jgi:glutathione synthase/RimK-type ligase-like ATP-grasp enzyme
VILILGEGEDPHTLKVMRHLDEMHAPYVRVWSRDFPQNLQGEFRFSEAGNLFSLSSDHHRIDLRDIDTVWFRRALPPQIAAHLSKEDQEFAKAEAEHFIRAVWRLLHKSHWVNSTRSTNAAESKPYQLLVAQSVGLDIPKTLITNTPSLVPGFFESCEGRMIYKPLTSYARDAEDSSRGPLAVFTNLITRDNLADKLPAVALAPCIFQEYIPKQIELRITVVGRELFTAAIHSQLSEKSKHD